MVRLDRLTTRTGDDGTTGRSDGSRLPKDHALMQAIGSIDEANSVLGCVRCEVIPTDLAEALPTVQNDLFDLGSDLASPMDWAYSDRVPRITAAHIDRLETLVESSVARIPPLTSFVLPGGTRAAAQLHVARTVVRRAEREVVTAIRDLGEAKPLNRECLRYLNRLSDLCFAWSRRCNDDGKADLAWVPGKHRNG